MSEVTNQSNKDSFSISTEDKHDITETNSLENALQSLELTETNAKNEGDDKSNNSENDDDEDDNDDDDGLTEDEARKHYGDLFPWCDFDNLTCDSCGSCAFPGCRCEPYRRFWQHWFCTECAKINECVSFCPQCYKTAKCPKSHNSPLKQWDAVKGMLLSLYQEHFPIKTTDSDPDE